MVIPTQLAPTPTSRLSVKYCAAAHGQCSIKPPRTMNKTHKLKIMDLTRFLNRRKWETVLKLLFYLISFLYYFDEFYYLSYRAYLRR